MNRFHKGKILISTPDIVGDIFSRSVILIIDHNEHGAFGLILNKKNTIASIALKNIFGTDIEVYDGGPVENDKVFFIIEGKPITEAYMELENDQYITEDIENVVKAVAEERLSLNHIKIFSGYSGWIHQQLEEEIKKKYWFVVGSYNMKYTENNPNMWKMIMQNLGGEFLIWANAPIDIMMN